jgi:hypothetical protein
MEEIISKCRRTEEKTHTQKLLRIDGVPAEKRFEHRPNIPLLPITYSVIISIRKSIKNKHKPENITE